MKTFKHTCLMCGNEFESKSATARFCKEQHYVTCCICGKQIEVPTDNVSYYYNKKGEVACKHTCNRALTAKKKGISLEEFNRQYSDAFKAGMQKKYGVDNPGQLKEVIEKRERTNLKKYGVRNLFESKEFRENSKKVCLEKYGTEYPTQSEEFKEKVRKSNLEKYGVEWVTQTEEFKEKVKASMLEKYGVEHALLSEEIQQKRKQTNLEKYGVDEVWKSPEVQEKIKQTNLERYGAENVLQSPVIQEKIKQTNLERYGKEYYTQTEEYKEKAKETCLKKYGVDHQGKSEEVQEKRKLTNLSKYGSYNLFSSNYGIKKIRKIMKQRYGVEYPSQVPEIRIKQIRNARVSQLEQRIQNILDNYGIEYVHHYHLSNLEQQCFHEFDFYLPKYKILIDADGVYYHAYMSDPDGNYTGDYYDDIRVSLVPEDHMLFIVIEGHEVEQLKEIFDVIQNIDENLFNYDSYLFRWCRSINFPYANYTSKRLHSDYDSLCNYLFKSGYIRQCRLGESIIKQFHKSIYDCKKSNSVSPKEAWYDDEKLKKVIKNRLIYVNNVDPSKILRGFNISKICPVVSMFNPILTKYIVTKYLGQYNQVFDPFSGFSGRLLGVASTGKSYIGQDLNIKVVKESNEIIDFLQLNRDRYQIIEKDILESSRSYECLLTCPPYGDKEIYNTETIFKSCDEWIDECLERFDCKTYAFVVDETSKYSDYIVEEFKSTSHFVSVTEKLLLINK